MTRYTNARMAGVALLVHTAPGLTSVMLFSRATGGVGAASKIASIGQHALDVRFAIPLSPVMSLSAWFWA